MTERKVEKEMMIGGEASLSSAPLPRHAQQVIGSRLRNLYGNLVCEPLPDRFLALLAQLASTESEPSADPDRANGN